MGVQKVIVGLKLHPVAAPLFHVTHGVLAEELDIGKAGPREPVFEAVAGGYEVGPGDLGVGLLREEGMFALPRNCLGFQDECPSAGERGVDVSQGVYRGGAMVDDAHEKEHVEAFGEEGQVLYPKQVDFQILLACHGIESLKAVVMLDGGFKTKDESGPVLDHSEHVIAVTAANVCHDLILEVWESLAEALPFSLALPFRVYLNPEDGEGAFAPRHETTKLCLNDLLLTNGDFFWVTYAYRILTTVDMGGGEGL